MSQNFSPIIAGTMLWGQWGKNYTTNEMATLITHCVDHDITTFDHADIYGGYSTEQEFGKALQATGLKRNQVQMISKCGIKMLHPSKTHRVKHYDYSIKHIIESCENSLRNLNTEYLDLFLLHRPSPLMKEEEIAYAISQLKSQGKIIDFGVSNFTPSQAALIAQHTPISFNQMSFSLTEHLSLTDGTFDHMKLQKVKVMAWAPLGNYFKTNNQQNDRIKLILDDLSKKYKKSADILLLNWIMRHPLDIIPVVGTTDKNRLTNIKETWAFEMDVEDWFLLYEASLGHRVP